jgi:dipeptidyl-peptidase-4
LTFLKDNSFIWTQKDGFQSYLFIWQNGKLKNQVTKGNWEVTYYGFDENENSFHQSVENGS